MISPHQPLAHQRPLNLIGGRIDIGGLPGLRRNEQQFSGMGDGRAVRDVREAFEEQGANIAQCLKAPAALKCQRPAQLCIPRHLDIIARGASRGQGGQVRQ